MDKLSLPINFLTDLNAVGIIPDLSDGRLLFQTNYNSFLDAMFTHVFGAYHLFLESYVIPSDPNFIPTIEYWDLMHDSLDLIYICPIW